MLAEEMEYKKQLDKGEVVKQKKSNDAMMETAVLE